MASTKETFGGVVSLTLTNLSSLASSPISGWASAAQDNTANLYLDALVQVNIGAVNTAPGGSKGVFVYAYALTDPAGTLYTTTGSVVSGAPSGSESKLFFPDITANPVNMPLIGTIPYVGQNATINGPPMSIARAFGGVLPPKYGVALVNHTGMTFPVSGSMSVQINPVYTTTV